MKTINISIPADWLPEQPPSPSELREAIRLGLWQLRRQQTARHQHREKIQTILAEAGLTQSSLPPNTDVAPLSSAERSALAQRAAAGGPLSEVIIADRADRV